MMAAKKTSVIMAFVLFTAIVGSGMGIFTQRTELAEARQPNGPLGLAVLQQEPLKNKSRGS